MLKPFFNFVICLAVLGSTAVVAQEHSAHNPIIHADVPDMAMIRVGDTYYMSSTTMHMSPGLPIMKSKDLMNWELVSYAYDKLDTVPALELVNGENAYGQGSWASSFQYHNGDYIVSTFSATSGKTHIYTTEDIEEGSWKEISFEPSYHDHTLHFDDDGKVYLIWGAGTIKMVELKEDLTGPKEGTETVLIQNATEPAGSDIMLQAEGSQVFKVNGKYYLFNIAWPRDDMRTVIVHRADKITGPYEGRVALKDKGVAQGGLIDTPEGEWFAYLFRDYGAVGRIPYLVPVSWKDGWPVLGENGKVPETLDLPPSQGLIPGIVASDDFSRNEGDRDLPLVWQWNHNPDPDHWSLEDREGFLRLITGRVDSSFLQSRNTLTQRTIGPESTAITKIDVSGMKEGDFAGLALLQKDYGMLGAKYENGQKSLVMVNAASKEPIEVEQVSLDQDVVYLKAVCDFRNMEDEAVFYYSLNGDQWDRIGNELSMSYTIPHFMGYRFALFNYSTKNPGGHVDFDYYRVIDE